MASLFEGVREVQAQQNQDLANANKDTLTRSGSIDNLLGNKVMRANERGALLGNAITGAAQVARPDLFGENPMVKVRKITQIRQQLANDFKGKPRDGEYFSTLADRLSVAGYQDESDLAAKTGMSTESTLADTNYKKSQTEKTKSESNLIDKNVGVFDDLFNKDLELKKGQIEQLLSSTKAIDIRNELLPQILNSEIKLNKAKIREMDAGINNQIEKLKLDRAAGVREADALKIDQQIADLEGAKVDIQKAAEQRQNLTDMATIRYNESRLRQINEDLGIKARRVDIEALIADQGEKVNMPSLSEIKNVTSTLDVIVNSNDNYKETVSEMNKEQLAQFRLLVAQATKQVSAQNKGISTENAIEIATVNVMDANVRYDKASFFGLLDIPLTGSVDIVSGGGGDGDDGFTAVEIK